jgi:hypothetical protein
MLDLATATLVAVVESRRRDKVRRDEYKGHATLPYRSRQPRALRHIRHPPIRELIRRGLGEAGRK